MKFFIPAAKDDEQAESVYSGIKKFAQENTGWSIYEDRIFAIKYKHEGKDYFATVGETENRTDDVVLAILKSTTYLVCTKNRGGVRGNPILVGINEVTSIDYFDK